MIVSLNLKSACRFSAVDHALQCAEQTTVKCPSPLQFRTFFVDVQRTFMTAPPTSSMFVYIPTCELIADGYCLLDVLSRQWN